MAAPTDARDALATADGDIVRLRAGLELDRRRGRHVLVERVDFDFTAERGLDEADRNLGDDVGFVALEPPVALDVEQRRRIWSARPRVRYAGR